MSTNPDNSPSASIGNGDSQGGSSFSHLSLATMVGLTIITGGLYLIYWLLQQTKVVNDHGETAVSIVVIRWAIVAWVASIVLTLYFFLLRVSPGDAMPISDMAIRSLSGLASIANALSSVLFVGWVFLIRDEVNRLSGARRGQPLWASAFWTACWHPFYLQYKINQIIESKKRQG